MDQRDGASGLTRVPSIGITNPVLRSSMRRSNSQNRRDPTAPSIPQIETRSRSADRAAWQLQSERTPRTKEKFIPLPHADQQVVYEEDESQLEELNNESMMIGGEDFSLAPKRTSSLENPCSGLEGVRGRIMVTTLCGSFDRQKSIDTIQQDLPTCSTSHYPEVVYVQTNFGSDATGNSGDVFIFDYGVVVCWSLDAHQEQKVLKMLRHCQVKPLAAADVQAEELAVVYSADTQPHIQNDCITISTREARDHQVKLAVSHALAQSSKLLVYEGRVWDLVEKVRHLPESLAKHGEIKMSRKQMAKLMGTVFIQKSEVNLLSSVLDTPEFFWSAPDALQGLYDKVTEYLELQERVALVNSRTMLIQSMLRIWSDHAAHHNLARLDRIIIILIVVEVLMAAAEVVGFFFHRSNQ